MTVPPLDPQDALRLSRLFVPRAARLEAEVKANKGRFVHYTSAEAAFKIIKSREFWLRNVRCMSDYMEVWTGGNLLRQFFAIQPNKDALFNAVHACAPGAAQDAFKLFDAWWLKVQFDTYVVSVSQHKTSEDEHGRLSMWRAFGRAQPGAALVMKMPEDGAARGLSLIFSPVSYDGLAGVEQEVRAIVANVEREADFIRTVGAEHVKNTLFFALVAAAVSLKHEGFSEELEWRAIHMPALYKSTYLEKAVEVVGGVPQVVYKIPLRDDASQNVSGVEVPQLIEKIIVGPSGFPFPLRDAFVAALGAAGVEDAEKRVVTSAIPIRP